VNAPILDARSSASVTFAVWEALFLREAVSRVSGGRGAWLWLLLEPVAQLALFLVVISAIRGRTASGYEYAPFLAIGILAYNLFKNTAQRSMAAISANKALFTYRQVKPVDVVLVRAFLEGIIQLIVSIVVLTGMSLLGFDSLPHDPLRVFVALALLWVLGMGLGLVLAVGDTLIAELGRLARLAFVPLYFLSGIFFSLTMLPHALRDWMLLNPIVHGLETLRAAFLPHYFLVEEVALDYLAIFAFASFFLGLALQVRFANRLVMQ
jgi:capsular polysaccharide transport system permease protein